MNDSKLFLAALRGGLMLHLRDSNPPQVCWMERGFMPVIQIGNVGPRVMRTGEFDDVATLDWECINEQEYSILLPKGTDTTEGTGASPAGD